MKVIGKQGTGRRQADADTLRLMRLVDSKHYAEVERAAREVLARNGRHQLAWRALSFALVGLERYEEVVAVADHALKINSGDGEVHNNRGIALSMLMRWDEAIADFQEAIRKAPLDFEIHMNLGTAFVMMRRWNDAVPPLLKAIELHPGDYLKAIVLLGVALSNGNRLDDAALCGRTLHESHPDQMEFLYGLLAVDLRRCEWSRMTEDSERLRGKLGGLGSVVTSPGWMSWFWFVEPAEHAEIARDFAAAVITKVNSTVHLPMLWRRGIRRLRLGYLSADFRQHAVAVVIAELIERHDRARVEVFAYSIGEDDRSSLRQRLMRGFEHFTDVASLSAHRVAERIRADGVDVLVDLTGWTAGGRVESLALRCAPIQVSWLGYAGTLGHSRLADYVIGDPEITPLCDRELYAERIVQMPHTYMPADTTRVVPDAPSRESQGLPSEAFVLCSFNNAYKFNPPLFDLWCSLLREMPDAVLWLPRHSEQVGGNLTKEIVRRGIAADRLVLADRIESEEAHLGRLQLADLALDTFPYNSHSTGVDVLWAGVPMVVKRGDTFAGRVGASLLAAAGLPELIADDDAGYATLVLDLYRDRPRLASLRRRLIEARTAAPLFDMSQFASDLENLYFAMADDAVRAATKPAAESSAEQATAA